MEYGRGVSRHELLEQYGLTKLGSLFIFLSACSHLNRFQPILLTNPIEVSGSVAFPSSGGGLMVLALISVDSSPANHQACLSPVWLGGRSIIHNGTQRGSLSRAFVGTLSPSRDQLIRSQPSITTPSSRSAHGLFDVCKEVLSKYRLLETHGISDADHFRFLGVVCLHKTDSGCQYPGRRDLAPVVGLSLVRWSVQDPKNFGIPTFGQLLLSLYESPNPEWGGKLTQRRFGLTPCFPVLCNFAAWFAPGLRAQNESHCTDGELRGSLRASLRP